MIRLGLLLFVKLLAIVPVRLLTIIRRNLELDPNRKSPTPTLALEIVNAQGLILHPVVLRPQLIKDQT
jgi:hypothetical protein